MEKRLNFYRDIHKGIRMLLADVVEKAGRTDYTSPRDLSLLTKETRSAFELLASHAEHEDHHIGPLVRQHAPELSYLVDDTHHEQEQKLPELEGLLLSIDPTAGEAVTKGHDFTVRMARFAGELLTHMSDEEEIIMPALWKAMTDAELHAVHQEIVASVPPDLTARIFAWIFPAMNFADLKEMFVGMRAHAPAEAFQFMRELARSVLNKEVDASLDAALA